MSQFQVVTTDFAMALPCNDWRASWEKDWQDYGDWRSFHQRSHNTESLLNWYMGEMSSLEKEAHCEFICFEDTACLGFDRVLCACDHSMDVVA